MVICFVLLDPPSPPRGPVNEDVFMAPLSAGAESKTMDSDIQEITEQIHRLLLQVRNDKEVPQGLLLSPLIFTMSTT